MAYLKITPGVGTLSIAGRAFSSDVHIVPDDLKDQVLQRDENKCRYCGFKADKYQEVNYVGSGDGNTAPAPDDYATACIFCYQCFHLERVARMQSGSIVWLPEISQAALHHMCRAIYVARISQGPIADAARDAFGALTARQEEAKGRLGSDNISVVSAILQDFLEVKEYKLRAEKLKGFRVLPLDRRIVKEGDLEFNQFPQVLAYWRSKDGPFGGASPRTWGKLFFEMREQMSAS